MSEETVYYRRNLPHLHPRDKIYFITFRLAGSLPVNVLQTFKEEQEANNKFLRGKFHEKKFNIEKYKLEKHNFTKFDNLLDKCLTGPQWLKDESIAVIVAKKIHELDGTRYKLIAYCIMSNHVHLLIDPTWILGNKKSNIFGTTKDYPLTDTLRLIKGSTARLCNTQLGRTGPFWHKESYDHYVRNGKEQPKIIRYILNNPVKAGLVENWQDWKFSFWNKSIST